MNGKNVFGSNLFSFGVELFSEGPYCGRKTKPSPQGK